MSTAFKYVRTWAFAGPYFPVYSNDSGDNTPDRCFPYTPDDILSLYGKILVNENPCSHIFYPAEI